MSIRGNGIAINGGLGIDLANITGGAARGDGVTANDCQDTDTGANGLQNFPDLFAPVATENGGISVGTQLRSSPSQPYTVDYYYSNQTDPTDYGEGANYIGSANVVTDGNGFAGFTFVSPGPVDPAKPITATATDAAGNTSEFSCYAGHCTSGTLQDAIRNAPALSCVEPIIVNIDTDEPDANTADGVCDTDTNISGLQCSLRAAIQEANARPGYNIVDFAIPGAGIHTISPATDLPAITGAALIDGTTQTGWAGSPVIEVRGDIGSAQTGIKIQTNNSKIYGLAINRFTQAGIQIIGNDSAIERCYIGIDPDGLTMDPVHPQLSGIVLQNTSSQNNVIGADFSNGGNVIGNSQSGILLSGSGVKNNVVKNNLIGTDINGAAALPNGIGITLAAGTNGNQIGGTLDEDTNVISGNSDAGIDITAAAQQNRVSGNLIGTNSAGSGPLPNAIGIAILSNAANNTIGGTAAERNIISGQNVNNQGAGIVFNSGAGQNTVAGNYIGTNKAGDAAIGNFWGISVLNTSQNVSGTLNAPNIISGNEIGVVLGSDTNQAVNNVTVSYNRIGTNPTGTSPLPNNRGVVVYGGVTNSALKNNLISGNTQQGVLFGGIGGGPNNNTVTDNKIGTNAEGSDAVPNRIGILAAFGADDNTFTRNLISGNTEVGIQFGGGSLSAPDQADLKRLFGDRPMGSFDPTENNSVQANKIGTDQAGTGSIPNGNAGIFISVDANNNLIGGQKSSFQGNVISGNNAGFGYGVGVGTFFGDFSQSDYPTGNKIQGNRIGIASSSYSALPNIVGIKVRTANSTLIGADPDTCTPANSCDPANYTNIIGGNMQQGIQFEGADATNNRVVSNFVGVAPDGTAIGNGGDGISLDRAPDNTIQGSTIGGNGGNGIMVEGDPPTPEQLLKPVRKQSPTLFDKKMIANLVGVFRQNAGAFSAVPNALAGINLHNASNVLIGGPLGDIQKNFIGGNMGPGILIEGQNATGNKINNSLIGTDENGSTGLGNGGDGVKLMDAPNNTIGEAIGSGMENTISGNAGNGVAIEGQSAEFNEIYGNAIGVANQAGQTIRLGNQLNGVSIVNSGHSFIGSVGQNLGNVISGNLKNGIIIRGVLASANQILHNSVGAYPNYVDPIGNSLHGIVLSQGANNTIVGGDDPNGANTITGNGGDGVWIVDDDEDQRPFQPTGSSPYSDLVRNNNIFGNTGLGIDIGDPGVLPNDTGDSDGGPNRGQNYPEISKVFIDGDDNVFVTYRLDTDPLFADYGSQGIRIDVYLSDQAGQGQRSLGIDLWTTDDQANGDPKTFDLGNANDLGITPADRLTATATDANNNTSEFFPVDIQTPTPTPSPTCPDVTTPVMTSKTGVTGVPVIIPVNTTDLSGLGVISADITFNYDPAVLSPLPANISVTAGSTSPGAEIHYNTPADGTVVISAINPTGFTGAGTVVDLHMKVIGPIGSISPLTLTNFRYNGGTVCSTPSGGILTVVSGTTTGRVSFENQRYPAPSGSPTPTPLPVPDTKVEAVKTQDLTSFFDLTNSNGIYSLSAFESGTYTVTPSKTPMSYLASNGIYADDPSLVAQYVVGLATLNSVQQRAADVSGLHSLSSFDAALIAQWVVGIQNPINQTGQWKFTPASTTPDTTLDNVQNYTALLMGDVNGDWTPPMMRPDSSIVPDTRNAVRVSIPNTKAAQQSLVILPLSMSDLRGRGIDSYQFDIEYDPAVLEPANVAADLTGTNNEGFFIAAHSPSPGLLKVVIYGTIPVTTDGVFVNLRFIARGAVGSTSPFSIRRFRINDGTISTLISSGLVLVTKASPSLTQ